MAEGTDATFSLKVGGKPKPEAKWFIQDQEITASDVYEMTSVEDSLSLTIKSTRPEHSGQYSAEVFNPAGSVSTNKASLTVECTRLMSNNLFLSHTLT